jgi:hypothetical protein
MREIQVVGAGSLGSFTVALLAKMASAFDASITVFDFDVVEPHNAFNQLYGSRHVGMYKVDALNSILSTLDAPILPITKRAGTDFEPNGIVVVLPDSMQTRREIFERSIYHANVPLFIDARTGENIATVYSLDPRNPDLVSRYLSTIILDANAGAPPCANQRTIPTLGAVAACVTKLIVRYYEDILPRSMMTETLISFEDLPSFRNSIYTD